MRDPLVGGLFEKLVVLEALKARFNAGRAPDLYYFRDRGGLEIDWLLERGRELHAFEIKSSRTWSSAFGQNMLKFGQKVAPIRSSAVIYAGEPMAGGTQRPACINFADAAAPTIRRSAA